VTGVQTCALPIFNLLGADAHEKKTQLAIFEPGGTLLQENRIPTNDLASFIHSLPANPKAHVTAVTDIVIDRTNEHAKGSLEQTRFTQGLKSIYNREKFPRKIISRIF
jgi:hypothetical protein